VRSRRFVFPLWPMASCHQKSEKYENIKILRKNIKSL
jgi:hypothetical protein